MRLQNNITVFSGDTRNNAQAEWVKKEGTYSYDKKSRSVYAGNFLKEFPLREKLQQKKAEAQQRAMKIVGDAWNADKLIDDEIRLREEHIGELREDNKDAIENLKEFRQMEDDLRRGYGVAADSEEQQDLEILERKHSGYGLTEEEKERLKVIQENGMTEYQSRAMELYKVASYYRKVIADNNIAAAEESDVIEDIRAERNKYHPMLDAQEQAEDVLAAARDEIIGIVEEEAKEHLDEEQEKREEQAEAIEEKREEQEEILEKREEREEELEELIEDMPVKEMADLSQTIDEVKQQVQKVLNEAILLEEDIKGAQVDMNV